MASFAFSLSLVTEYLTSLPLSTVHRYQKDRLKLKSRHYRGVHIIIIVSEGMYEILAFSES